MPHVDRRRAAAWLGASAATTALPGRVAAAPTPSPIDDVRRYDALGEHRTGTSVDDATSDWLAERLRQAGLAATLQPFAFDRFMPRACRVVLPTGPVAALPAWPVRTTPAAGVVARLAPAEAPDLRGCVAVVRFPFHLGGHWGLPGYGDAVMQAAGRGALGVVAVTNGPTGEIVALNAQPERFVWPVPVVLVAGRDGDALSAAATAGVSATLVLDGEATPGAKATNVVARRRGSGRTLVVSTPKSGWFRCAGERGTGIAVFLALAERLARTPADLLFVAFSGHELNELGGRHFLRQGAPAPAEVACWLHIGANAAMQGLTVRDGRVVPDPQADPERRITAASALLPFAQTAFAGRPGYAAPAQMTTATAVGELSVFFAAGYAPVLAGLGGRSRVFHTPADRADVVTTPQGLAEVTDAGEAFLAQVARRAG